MGLGPVESSGLPVEWQSRGREWVGGGDVMSINGPLAPFVPIETVPIASEHAA